MASFKGCVTVGILSLSLQMHFQMMGAGAESFIPFLEQRFFMKFSSVRCMIDHKRKKVVELERTLSKRTVTVTNT